MTLTVEVAPAATGKRQWFALGVLCLATLLVSLDLFVMLLAVPAVTQALGRVALNSCGSSTCTGSWWPA